MTELKTNWTALRWRQANISEVFDVKVLVNRSLLAKHGSLLTIVNAPLETASIATLLTSLGDTTLQVNVEYLSKLDPEEVYVMLAHEISHVVEVRTGKTSVWGVIDERMEIPIHSDRPSEQRAIFWESMQASKFGWTQERYRRYVGRVYSIGRGILRSSTIPEEVVRRGWAARSWMSRRPVRVQAHRRRSP